ncbi:MAG: ABC transporter permease [Nitrospirae bacterium]|nr:ABC transporter permease [Nitrospirota bacterium]
MGERLVAPKSSVQGNTTAHLVIKPSRGWSLPRVSELWEYRDLLWLLSWRNISVRYKQTLLGAGWAIIQPVFSMIVFTLLFGQLAHMPSEGLPYPVFSYTALLPWTYFATSMSAASNSVVANANLFSKVYFPRLILPISVVLSGLIDFALAFLVLIGMMIFYAIPLTWNMLWLPVFSLLAMISALGVGLWLSVMGVQYRDIRFATPFLIQIWMYASPVIYPSSLIPERWKLLYDLNPMSIVLDGFRWALLGTGMVFGPSSILSVLIALGLLLSGAVYFQHVEETFADLV